MIDSVTGRAVRSICNMRSSDLMYVYISHQGVCHGFPAIIITPPSSTIADVICLGESLNDNGVL